MAISSTSLEPQPRQFQQLCSRGPRARRKITTRTELDQTNKKRTRARTAKILRARYGTESDKAVDADDADAGDDCELRLLR